MLVHLNLRAVLATDVARRHVFGDYVAARLTASAVGMAAIGWLAVESGGAIGLPSAILLGSPKSNSDTQRTGPLDPSFVFRQGSAPHDEQVVSSRVTCHPSSSCSIGRSTKSVSHLGQVAEANGVFCTKQLSEDASTLRSC
jgi:hypothetical protein